MPELLAQQTLLDRPPSRRIIVPAGHSAWWGADPAVGRLSVAVATAEGPRAALTASFGDLRSGARLAHIWRETGLFVAGLVRDGWPVPGLVWVEQPSGQRTVPELLYAVGVIQGAIYDALQLVTGHGVLVETVPSSSWKKAACGSGAIRKPTRKALGRAVRFEDYGVARWAAANGYRGSSWDEADALGIADAARRTVALDER